MSKHLLLRHRQNNQAFSVPFPCLSHYLLLQEQFVYKAFRSKHTQLVYADRLEACEEELSHMYLDDLYEERICRCRRRLPVLHGGTHVLRDEEDYREDPVKLLFTVLEV